MKARLPFVEAMPATCAGGGGATVVSPATSAGTVVVGPGTVVVGPGTVVVDAGTVVDVVELLVVVDEVVVVVVVDEVVLVVVVHPFHCNAVPVSNGNSSGPCHGPDGEICGGVTEFAVPAIRSNWRGLHAFWKATT